VILATGVVLIGLCGTLVHAQQENLLVSGQSTIGTIDADGDGPDAQDCTFTAFISNVMTDPMNDFISSTLDITSSQSNMPTLRACTMDFQAVGGKGVDSSSNFLQAYIYNATGPMGFDFPGDLPFFIDIYDETTNRDLANPVLINDPLDLVEFENFGSDTEGEGRICSVNGNPAAQFDIAGLGFLVDLELFPNAANPTHLQLPGPPAVFEVQGGGFQSFDAYIPVTPTGHITIARESDPNDLLLDIDLDALPACGAVGGGAMHGAPTMTQTGLIALALGLLAFGTFALSRRPAFARSLSL